jgi:hypothetical protein
MVILHFEAEVGCEAVVVIINHRQNISSLGFSILNTNQTNGQN